MKDLDIKLDAGETLSKLVMVVGNIRMDIHIFSSFFIGFSKNNSILITRIILLGLSSILQLSSE